MAKGRPPKPTAIKILNGNPGNRELNKSEPGYTKINAENIPPCPETLNKNGKKEWDRICILLGEFGILTEADQTAMMLYCQYFGIWIEAMDKIKSLGMIWKSQSGYPMPSPYIAIANKAEEKVRHYSSEFGMTPSSRSRMKAPKPGGKKDDIGDLLD